MPAQRQEPMFIVKLIAGIVMNLTISGGLLFLPAGTLRWWRAWVFMGVIAVGMAAVIVILFPGGKELLAERLKLPIQKGQPLADRIIVLLYIAAFIGLFVFIPLDVFRFHLLGKPGAAVSSLGLLLVVAGWCIISLSLKENPFAAQVVRHQEERGQRVVDTGVYSLVRHPLYAGAVLLMAGLPLWLESYAAALLAAVPMGTLVIRILVEERFLKQKLKGYEAYTEKVRYRLIPYLW
jgi:protein-S-isoprenylcysteine O-methyltransferase Ste14